MGKNLVKGKDIQKLEIPQLSTPLNQNLLVNFYKIERERAYAKTKLSKLTRKNVHA